MSKFTVSHGSRFGMTMVANRFIDEFMREANDAQIKIYLYLLRVVGSDSSASVSDIADYFNYTEKDVLRALKYWNNLHVITLLYNEQGELTGIHLEKLEEAPRQVLHLQKSTSESVSEPDCPVISDDSSDSGSVEPQNSLQPSSAVSEELMSCQEFTAGVSLDEIKDFQSREATSELVFIVEQYLGRPLSPGDLHTLYFMTDYLHMSNDLVDYLVQYCVERGKKDFHYMEKVALSWCKQGIITPKQAAAGTYKYEKQYYSIMKDLGRSAAPTEVEAAFITRWIKEYGFEYELISLACKRAVLATEKHRFEYAEGILKNWLAKGVKTLKDVDALDASHKSKPSGKAAAKQTAFGQHKKSGTDYADIWDQISVTT